VYFHELHRRRRAVPLLSLGREGLLSVELPPEFSLPPVKGCLREIVPTAIFCLGQTTLGPL
jgi:hypothetical protein